MRQRTMETFRRILDAYDLHNAHLFKRLRRNDVERRDRRSFEAFSKEGFRYDGIDWNRYVDLPDLGPDRLQNNTDVSCLVAALLNVFDDIKPFAHYLARSGNCTVARDCGLNLAPLTNYDRSGAEAVARLFPEGLSDCPYPRLSADYIRTIHEVFRREEGGKSLLGRQAESYIAILKHWTDYSQSDFPSEAQSQPIIDGRNIPGFVQVMKRIVELLYKRYPEVTNERRRERLREALDDSLALYLRLCVTALLDGGYGRGAFRLGMREAATLMSDELAGVIAGRFHEVFSKFPDRARLGRLSSYDLVKNLVGERDGFFLRYRFYRKKFIRLGDEYGDCTACAPASQVDLQVRNIHWTVYPWLLNPCYRVLEVCRKDGKGLLKAHIVPLVVEGRTVLMVDAIESVPSLRLEAQGRERWDFNDAYFRENAHEAFFLLMNRCVELGREIGAEAVYADMYSNAVWVRRLLEQHYDHDSYDTANVEIPFSNYEVEDNMALIRQNAGFPPLAETTVRTKMEIQAINMHLMHQGTRGRHKIVSVLSGLRSDWKLKFRGL